MTEKRVIGGLQNLTHLLFNNHFKHNDMNGKQFTNENANNSIQSNEITTSSESPTSTTADVINKENNRNLPSVFKATHDGCEKFCALVVQQLAGDENVELYEEDWHRDQLNAYNNAHDHIFEKN